MTPPTAQLETHVIPAIPDASDHISNRARENQSLITALVSILNELAIVTSDLTDEQYTASPVGVMPSSIAAHVRHCLDHIRTITQFQPRRLLDYDLRQRGTAVETRRSAALAEISDLIDNILALDGVALDRPLRMATLFSPTAPAQIVETTVGRELAYALSHTIHHNALIGAMILTLGGNVPPHFGWAPSTIRHLEQSRCAR